MPNSLFDKFIAVYHKSVGLLLGVLVITLFAATLNGLVADFFPNIIIRAMLLILSYIIHIVVWIVVCYRLPKTIYKNGVAVIISFETESKIQQKYIEVDVIEKVKNLLGQYGLDTDVKVFTLTGHQVKKINTVLTGYLIRKQKKYEKSFTKIIYQNQYSVYIWGQIIQRNDTEEKIFIESNVVSRHTELPTKFSEKLSGDMGCLIPNKMNFPVLKDYVGFDLTKEMLYLAIRYITGTILFFSEQNENLYKAYKLHYGLIEELTQKNFPNYDMIVAQLKIIIGIELFYISRIEFNEKKERQKALEMSVRALEYFPNSFELQFWNGYLYFDVERNTGKAINCFNFAQNLLPEMKICKFNIAFIYFYLRRFDEALKILDELARNTSDEYHEMANMCIEYDIEVYKKEADKIQLLFLVGYLWYRIMDNPVCALEYFEDFLKMATKKRHFAVLTKRANKYLRAIKLEVPY